VKLRDGDTKSAEELVVLFNPLILKLSCIIRNRYGSFQLEEIKEQARVFFLSTTILEYEVNGKAKYPYFIKRKLHAKLVQYYRPLSKERLVVLYEDTPDTRNIEDDICKEELHKLHCKLLQYIRLAFTSREKEIINKCMCKNIPRSKIAHKYHTSKQRVINIQKHIITRLRMFLYTIGIKKYEDI